MRTTHGKTALDWRLEGEPRLAAALRDALGAASPVERATHGFHTWPAGLHPDAARGLLRVLGGASVLDPFCGGGTVLVEGMLAGRRTVGRDLSSVACLVARTRTRLVSEEACSRMRAIARELTERARHARTLPPPAILERVGGWYAPHVLVELEAIRAGIVGAGASEEVEDLLWACFSSILVKSSHRRSDTSEDHAEQARPPGTTAILFHKKARELGRRLAALREAVPAGTPSADVRTGDARALKLDEPVDLVLTSPPYPTVYDYLPFQQIREVWLGVRSPADREIGARRAWAQDPLAAEQRWLADTAAWMRRARGALRPGGTVCVVIGDGRDGERTIDAEAATLGAGRACGLVPRAGASAARPEHVRGGVRWEHAIVLSVP